MDFFLHPWASSQCGDIEQGEALKGSEERKIDAEEYNSFLSNTSNIKLSPTASESNSS